MSSERDIEAEAALPAPKYETFMGSDGQVSIRAAAHAENARTMHSLVGDNVDVGHEDWPSAPAALPVPALSELDEDLRGGPWWPEPPLEDEIGDRGGEVNLTNRAGDSLLLKAADVAKIIADLEAAIAHDRQPYPTAWAYEQACKARDEWKRKAEALPVPALDHPRTYSLVGSPHLFLVTDDESHMNIGYADQIGGPLVAYLGEDTPAEAALPVPAREHGIVPQSEDAWEAPVPALSDEGIEWLLARIEETRTSYNEVLARHPNDPILRELRWAIGHATLAAEVAANARAALPVPALDALTYERAWMDLMDEARAFEAWYLPTRMGVNAWVGVDTTSGFYGGWSIEGDPLYDDWDESVMTTASGATPEAVIADLIGIARDYRARRDAEYAALGEDVK